MKSKSTLLRLFALAVAVVMLLSAVGCTKTVRTYSSYVGGDDDVIIGWEEDDEGTGDGVLTGDNGNTTTGGSTTTGGNTTTTGGNTTTTGGTTGSGNNATETPTVNFDVYANIPKNVKQIKVLLWYTPDATEQAVISAFEKKFGIKVKQINTDTSGYLSKLTTLVMSKDAPDVAALYDFPTPVTKDLFESIDVATSDKGGAFNLEKDNALDLNAMNLTSWKGKYYGVQLKGNWHENHEIVIFNRTLFKNKGITDPYTLWQNGQWNWSALESCAKNMTYLNNGVQIYGLAAGSNVLPTAFAASTGTNLLTIDNKNGNIINNFGDSNVLNALTFVTRLRSAGYVSSDTDWNTFVKGQCAMWVTNTTQVKKGREFDQMTDDWTYVPVPSPDGQTQVAGYTTITFGIPKGAKNGIAGSYFIRWLLDSNNWNIRNTFSTEEHYNIWLKLHEYQTCYYPIYPVLDNSSGLRNSIEQVTKGSVNDVATGLKALSGSADSAIKTVKDGMS